MQPRFVWLACSFAAAIVGGRQSLGAITGPYSVDANTLHLYHLDEAGGSTSAADATVAQNMLGVLNGATLGNASFAGFGTSLDTAADALVPPDAPTTVPHRPILAAAATLSNAGADDVTLDWAGADGAFTLEAIIKFDASFDPANPSYRNAGAATGGNYPMEILSGEGESANARRLFQFRFNQIGAGTATNVGSGSGTTAPRIEFHNLRGISANQPLAVDVPTTGLHAVNNTDWFHVAVAYNGAENTANNISFYWTKLDASVIAANLLGQAQLNADPVEGLTGFAIGNETRDAGSGAGEGESFVGRIDEVRISSVARGANQFVFVPEPSTAALALALLAFLRPARRLRFSA
jgi:hypothetical protein